jgi:hypothetical protein
MWFNKLAVTQLFSVRWNSHFWRAAPRLKCEALEIVSFNLFKSDIILKRFCTLDYSPLFVSHGQAVVRECVYNSLQRWGSHKDFLKVSIEFTQNMKPNNVSLFILFTPCIVENQITQYSVQQNVPYFFQTFLLQYLVDQSYTFRSPMGSSSGVHTKATLHKTELAIRVHNKKT